MKTQETANSAQYADASGFRYFSAGDTGDAHQLAHECLDEGRLRDGYEQLGAWLAEHDGEGSDWIHVQWHMAVFEIAMGEVDAAHQRFRRHILPQVAGGKALTDAPSLLWRLWLAGKPWDELEWAEVRAAAQKHLECCDDDCANEHPYVVLHDLLAAAGARDTRSIDRWLDRRLEALGRCRQPYLLQLALAFRSFAQGSYEPSAKLLRGVERVGELGGSRAQNELFEDIRILTMGAGLRSAA